MPGNLIHDSRDLLSTGPPGPIGSRCNYAGFPRPCLVLANLEIPPSIRRHQWLGAASGDSRTLLLSLLGVCIPISQSTTGLNADLSLPIEAADRAVCPQGQTRLDYPSQHSYGKRPDMQIGLYTLYGSIVSLSDLCCLKMVVRPIKIDLWHFLIYQRSWLTAPSGERSHFSVSLGHHSHKYGCWSLSRIQIIFPCHFTPLSGQ